MQMRNPQVGSEGRTSEGLLNEHEYGIGKLVCLTDSHGVGHHIVKLHNPHGSGEWKGLYCDSCAMWEDPALQAARLTELDMTNLAKDGGAFCMPWAEFRAQFTRIDVSEGFAASACAQQVCGLITEERCGDGRSWWRNPKYVLRLKEPTTLTIALNQPNTKVLGLGDEEYPIKMGFKAYEPYP